MISCVPQLLLAVPGGWVETTKAYNPSTCVSEISCRSRAQSFQAKFAYRSWPATVPVVCNLRLVFGRDPQVPFREFRFPCLAEMNSHTFPAGPCPFVLSVETSPSNSSARVGNQSPEFTVHCSPLRLNVCFLTLLRVGRFGRLRPQ